MEFLTEFARWITKSAPPSLLIAPTENELAAHPQAAKPRQAVFAFIIGHNKKAQGSVSYQGETEYIFNERRAMEATIMLHDHYQLTSYIIYRPPVKSYEAQVDWVVKECQRLGVTHAVELHCNSFATTTRGLEVLIAKTPQPYDDKLAAYVANRLAKLFDIKLRGTTGVKTIEQGHSGFGMLNRLYSFGVTAMIIEPCFWNVETDESSRFLSNRIMYSKFLADLAKVLIKGEPI